MPETQSKILRARVVLPVFRPPIHEGAVFISGGRIADIGAWPDISAKHAGIAVEDLGDVILFPGLINAHCHLDYTHMAGKIMPGHGFTGWITEITTLKADWSADDFANSWLSGASMLLKSGVTCVADIEALPEVLPKVADKTPLRVYSFIEMTGVRSKRPSGEILADAESVITSGKAGRGGFGLSPHAPYSTAPELLKLSAHLARQKNWRVAIHVAESQEEYDMFMRRSGVLHDWLVRNGRDMSDCGLGSPVQHLERQGLLGDNLIAVHANHLWDGDVSRLASSGTSVVHCPRSHAFFQNKNFPFRQLSAAGVNICIGTDSLATVTGKRGESIELDLFSELRSFAQLHPDVRLETLVEMVTTRGAKAMGLESETGDLAPGKWADLATIPAGSTSADPYETFLQHRGPVKSVMIDGQWQVLPDIPKR